MSEFRPRLSLLCLVAFLALVGVFGVRAGFTTEPGLRAAQAWLVSPLPVTGAVKVADKSGPHAAGYVWSATRIESGIRLRGSVPTDEDRRTVLGMVKAHFPDLEVEDRLKINTGAPPQDQWLGAVSFGLKQLSHLKRGSARLLNVALKVDGEARSAADYMEVKKALAGPLPTGLTIAGESITAAPGPRSWWALVYLIGPGSLIAFSAYAYLLRTVRPVLATSYAYVNPVVAVGLGVTLGGEQLTGETWIALPLILGAVGLIARGRS